MTVENRINTGLGRNLTFSTGFTLDCSRELEISNSLEQFRVNPVEKVQFLPNPGVIPIKKSKKNIFNIFCPKIPTMAQPGSCPQILKTQNLAIVGKTHMSAKLPAASAEAPRTIFCLCSVAARPLERFAPGAACARASRKFCLSPDRESMFERGPPFVRQLLFSSFCYRQRK